MIPEQDVNWFLSGQPVARIKGRDYVTTTEAYTALLKEYAEIVGCLVTISDFDGGILVQAYKRGEKKPVLPKNPEITKATVPALFCRYKGCEQRVEIPGSDCGQHD